MSEPRMLADYSKVVGTREAVVRGSWAWRDEKLMAEHGCAAKEI
jgi:hypothetical protein